MIGEKYKVPSDLTMYYPGISCGCQARNRGECGCDADWTSLREYELMAEVNSLRAMLESEGYVL